MKMRSCVLIGVVALGGLSLLILPTPPLGAGEGALQPRHSAQKPTKSVVPRGYDPRHVEVKFLDDLDIVIGPGGYPVDRSDQVLKSAAASAVFETISRAGGKWERLPGVSEQTMDSLRAHAQASLQRVIADMNTYFFLSVPDGVSAAEWMDRLNALPEVEIASPISLPMPPPVPNYVDSQGYLDPATDGIDAEYAWPLLGGTGAGVTICDLEYSWNLNHQDLPFVATLIPPGYVASDPDADSNQHGTAVLGEMVSLNNGWGTTGAAYGATAVVAPVYLNGWRRIATVIPYVTDNLTPGDVILIEQQTMGPNYTGDPVGTQIGMVPVEWDLDTYAAILTAVGNGFHVVEAAGNGDQDLDDPTYVDNSGWGPFLEAYNSGAIIVGAGAAPNTFGGTAVDRSRLTFPNWWGSNYGSRVDVQGWGERVMTTGYGDGYGIAEGESPNLYYTWFSGTSSASPIVASAVALLESIYEQRTGLTLSPAIARSTLILTGSRQQVGTNPPTQRIGPRPNLRAALALWASPFTSEWPLALLYQENGAAANDWLGNSVAGAGDVNADGRADFIIAAEWADPGGRGDAGSAYVYSGLNGLLLYQKDGAAAGDGLGYSVAGAGDVSGDGRADFIIGAINADPGGRTNAGSAYVYSGLDGSLLYQMNGAAAGDLLGYSVAGAGDVNGDGRADFIIGAPYADPGGRSNAGSVYVYSGLDGLLLYQMNGAAVYDVLGSSVAGAGDVNGDGRADFIIGAPGADPGGRENAGSAYVYSGVNGSLLYQMNGAFALDWLGSSVAGAGYVNWGSNGDWNADFIIGAPGADPGGRSNAGSVYVYSGVNGSLLYQNNGAAAGDNLGSSVAGAGDVNRDGYADFIIGAPGADPSGRTDAGSAYVYSGLNGSLLYQRDGAAAGDNLGSSVAGAGDVSGDWTGDLIIGAPQADPGGQSNAGSAYVLQSGYRVRIPQIVDVGNDQGRRLRLWWLSWPAGDNFVRNYAIYRRLGPYQSGAKVNDPFNLKSMPPGDWEFVVSVPASGDTIYATVVPTVADSTIAHGMYWSVFFVRAMGDNPTDHFDSPPDSGYSLDNLAPAPPTAVVAVVAGPNVDLDWRPVADADFDYYWIYRDTLPGFVPLASRRVGATSDSSFLDQSVPSEVRVYYKVCAVDFSGNEGGPSNEVSVGPCACPCHGDPQCDGVTNVQDVVKTVDVAFRGAARVFDPNCPRQRTDVNCDGVTSVVDVVKEVNVAFRGANPATQFCDPCAP